MKKYTVKEKISYYSKIISGRIPADERKKHFAKKRLFELKKCSDNKGNKKAIHLKHSSDLQKQLLFKEWYQRELFDDENGGGSFWAGSPVRAWVDFCYMFDNVVKFEFGPNSYRAKHLTETKKEKVGD